MQEREEVLTAYYCLGWESGQRLCIARSFLAHLGLHPSCHVVLLVFWPDSSTYGSTHPASAPMGAEVPSKAQ